MKSKFFVWPWLFGALVLAYGLLYAPYGVNETDGGFLTGLAWQVLNGKTLYRDVLYVRPPIPVWLHAAFLKAAPAWGAVLVERWLFYLKVAAYSAWGASVLARGARRWQLAALGFVVSAHCYPASAWHTVDGILFAVLGLWLTQCGGRLRVFLGGVSVAAAVLCKQSFYPLALLWIVYAVWRYRRGPWAWGVGGLVAGLSGFAGYLVASGLWSNFWIFTSGAASGGQAFQHGVLDYFRINPAVALLSALLLALVLPYVFTNKYHRLAAVFWLLWLAALGCSYLYQIQVNQDFTLPFAQSRLAFWAGALWFVFGGLKRTEQGRFDRGGWTFDPSLLFLLGISWAAAVSWGYSLPILFATPWIFGLWAISDKIRLPAVWRRAGAGLALALLLVVFGYAYRFVYRDGPRSAMQQPLGALFPALDGIYTDSATAALYTDFYRLKESYWPNFKTLPAFPQANYLTAAPPPLPLDWVVAREMAGQESMVREALRASNPAIFLEKTYAGKLPVDPELKLVYEIVRQSDTLQDTPHFIVLKWRGQ